MQRRRFLGAAMGAAASLPLLSPLARATANLGNWGESASADAYVSGNFGPVAVESSVVDLKVTGELPKELIGRYVRNGPNPSSPTDAGHHWFIGDGMVHGIRIEEGRVSWYRNRYVKGGANTHVIGHAGKTLAIVEAGGKPVHLTEDLETVGFYDFEGTLPGAFSAHPKRDPDTGDLHVMTYNPGPPPFQVQYVRVTAGGVVDKVVDIPVAGPVMVHDTSITRNWVLVYDLPVTANPQLAQQGYRFPMQWNPDYGARVGLLPRNGGAADVVWIDVPLCYVFHPMNAYETEDGKISVDLCRYDRMFDGNFNGPFAGNVELTLDRWVLDPKRRTVSVDRVDDRAQEFPRAHPSLESKPYRYGYAVTVDGPTFPQILKHDLKTGESMVHDLRGRSSGEAVFVPREGATAEDDGFLMSWVYDPNKDVSEFVVLDAQAMVQLASVRLPVRVPYGFHGSWIADA